MAEGEGAPGHHPMVLEGEEEERGKVKSRAEFLMLLMSLAVGTRSVIQFPSLAMQHGGGAFTFVYLLLMSMLGLPLLYMEMVLGQYARGGPISAWKITPLSRGMSYSMVLVSVLFLIHGNTYTAWSLLYWFYSFSSPLPWHANYTDWDAINSTLHQLSSLVTERGGIHDNHNITAELLTTFVSGLATNFTINSYTINNYTISIPDLLERCYRNFYAQHYFYEEALGLSSGIEDTGSIQVYLFLCLLLAWALTALAVVWGPQSMGKVRTSRGQPYITGIVPVILLVILLGGMCSLSGSVTGLRAFLTPRWKELAKIQLLCVRFQMWWDAAKLVLNSFACGTGVIISLSAWAHFHSNCFRNSMITTALTVSITLLGGCMLFAALGSQMLLDVSNIQQLHMSGVDLAFGLFPTVASRLPIPSLWLVMWFSALILGGVGFQSALLHNVYDSFVSLCCIEKRKSRMLLLVVIVLLLFLLGLSTVTQGGLYVVQFLEHYVYLLSVPAMCLAEVMTLMWLYGVQRLANRVSDMTGKGESFLWKWLWKFLCPAVLVCVIILSFSTRPSPLNHSPSTSLLMSFASLTSSLLTFNSSLTSSLSLSSETTSSPLSLSISSLSSLIPDSASEPSWSVGVGMLLTCVPLLPALLLGLWLFCLATGTGTQRLKALGTTPRSWGPRHLEHEPQLELPDYVICSPDVYRPANALALLTANLYLPNLASFLSVEQNRDELENGEMSHGYLSDLMTVTSSEDESGDQDENQSRGNWSGRLEFVFTCLGYVVGLGNIWRFPYLVYRNGGGAFFIAYFIMLIFCGLPLVFMELAFGQFASLGPITVWKAAPLFKGVGYAMVLISALVSIYYNMVTAWAFHFLFTSLTSRLPWGFCNNTWNTGHCTINKYAADNCSAVNQTVLLDVMNRNHSCHAVLRNCSSYNEDIVGQCVSKLKDIAGNDAVASYGSVGTNHTSASEEYFYRSVLDVSSGLGKLGSVKWQMALCLLLCWVIVFFCLVKGIKTAGKVSYVVVLIPYIAILVLLIRSVSMTGSSDGIHFYTTPKWELLRQPRMWGDAAAQVFFSLSVCWGGLATLASYNKFHNNVYRDALLVCVGDTLMSIMSGFAVFAMVGVLSEKLGASVRDVIQSDVGMTFIVYPAALMSFPVPSLWSILFFLMLVTMGLGTTFSSIETIITAIIDEHPPLKKKRMYMLLVVCVGSFLLGLPLTAQGGMYLLQLMDEYLCSFPLMICGLVMCMGIAWVYGLNQFCADIEHMISRKVSLWWRFMWSSASPVVILFIIISSAVGYLPLGSQFDYTKYPWWSEVVGFFFVVLCVSPIVLWPVIKIRLLPGSLWERMHVLCRPTRDWGPALEKNSHFVEYFPAVQTNLLSSELDSEHPAINTITDHVEFTTVGVRVSSESQPSLLPVTSVTPGTPATQQLPNGARAKAGKPMDMRHKAILNHAYSNPQCHLSNGSIEKLTQTTRQNSSSDGALNDVVITPRIRIRKVMKDASTQTIVSCFEKIKRQTSEPIGRATTPPTPRDALPRSMSWMQEGEPAVIEVEVTRF
ncbi:uncharacterized protein [Littorina saxatilis]|uniref:uncharacterized protein n=1 Tax=Littorina saxatilis TaxID=31220 RepID=UPI0038B429E5